ncbi:High affinity immunoglobulin epsilon receptor subunit gamma Fc receptor gamma-chain [Collichthys lucidus]|nr:High affinity immunoglobulin epsilon receptor subunit gamma Fc receptor gamma-chain [Collichthys lucidus]
MLRALHIAVFLIIYPTCAEAIGDMGICYILDGILIVYGIILTILYCRLRGLTSHSTDTYETIKIEKKPIV